MGNSTIPNEVRDMVVRAWREIKRRGEEPRAKEVRAEVARELKERGRSDHQLPQLRTVQDILQKARQRFSEDEKALDEPWCMGSLERYPLPPDALPAVLRVWKLMLTFYKPLTIREATWVARLHSVGPDDTESLMMWAGIYAEQEASSAALNQPSDSSALDASLVMDYWEWATVAWIRGQAWVQTMKVQGPQRPHVIRIGDSESEQTAESAEHLFYGKLEECQGNTDGRRQVLARLADLGLSEEATLVYAHWLSYLSDGPRLRDLTHEDVHSIIVRLRDWVLSHPWNNLDEEAAMQVLGVRMGFNSERLAAIPHFAPWELLSEVGYDVKPTSLRREGGQR